MKDLTGLKETDLSFTFSDLFCGIGSFRLALEAWGGRCVYSNDNDKNVRLTYEANFGKDSLDSRDIKEVNASDIPPHDLLCAGFPCQSFSMGGNRLGFLDLTRGTLFFDVARVLAERRPSAFILENVLGLLSDDNGRTIQTIMNTLHELEYDIYLKVLDAAEVVPQHRERVFIVGFREELKAEFEWPSFPKRKLLLKHCIETDAPMKYVISSRRVEWLKEYRNGRFWARVHDLDVKPRQTVHTLVREYRKLGYEILIRRPGKKRPRLLMPIECARLMGFPESFVWAASEQETYRQLGNSIVVPLLTEIAGEIVSSLIVARQRGGLS